jgi:hypothetical protein
LGAAAGQCDARLIPIGHGAARIGDVDRHRQHIERSAAFAAVAGSIQGGVEKSFGLLVVDHRILNL